MAASFRIKVTTNAKEVSALFGELNRRQLPFAAAKTLTGLARGGAEAQQAAIPRRFDVRNRGLPKAAVKWQKANKRDWPRVRSTVGVPDKFRFLVDHELGGKRTARAPSPGRGVARIAVPVPQIHRRQRTARGKVKKPYQPRELIRRGAAEVQEGRRGGLIRLKRGRRRKALGKHLGILYSLHKSVRLRPALRMRVTVNRYARMNRERVFAKEFRAAVRTTKNRKGRRKK